MAIAATAVWEIRSGGSDNNGGGFDPAIVGGTDYSLQTAAQVALNGTTITASTPGINNNITLTGYTVAATDVGNMVQITGGTNFITGIYEITSVSVGALNTWNLDRNCTSAAGSGMTGNMGGCFATVAKGISSSGPVVAGNKVWIKAATYTITTGLTAVAGSSGARIQTKGYNSTRGDLDTVNDFSNFPNIVDNNANIVMWTMGTFNGVENVVLDAGSGGTKAATGFSATGGAVVTLINCKTTGAFASNGGYQLNAAATVFRCLSTGCSAAAGGFNSNSQAARFIGCVATAGTGPGFIDTASSNAGMFIRCISYNNSGASSDGFRSSGGSLSLINCIGYNNGRHGAAMTGAASADNTAMGNNIFVNNGGYGMATTTTTWDRLFEWKNAFYNNTSGPVNGFTADSTDINLSGDPFTNAAAGDFSLNNTAGAGAACRAAGFPGVMPLGLATGYLDIGTAQHQDAGGGGLACNPISGFVA